MRIPDQFHLKGTYQVSCYGVDRSLKWQDVIHNLVPTVGKNKALDTTLDNSAGGAVVMGLMGVGTASAGDTQASHPGWLEVGGTNIPAYSGNRMAPSFSAASLGTKSTSAVVAFTFTTAGTVAGCFVNVGGGNTKDGTAATLSADVDVADADITYTFALLRVDSAGTLLQTLGTSGTLSGAGLKSHTVNIGSPIATNAGDRLVGKIAATRGASHGNQALTISVSGENDQLIGAWSSSTTHEVTTDEAMSFADAKSGPVTFSSTSDEAVTAADAESAFIITGATSAESVTLSDSQAANNAVEVSIAEAMSLADSQDRTYVGAASSVEALSLSDAPVSTVAFASILDESFTLADSSTGTVVAGTHEGTTAEAVSLADVTSATLSHTAEATDAISLSEEQTAAGFTIEVTVEEQLLLADIETGTVEGADEPVYKAPKTTPIFRSRRLFPSKPPPYYWQVAKQKELQELKVPTDPTAQKVAFEAAQELKSVWTDLERSDRNFDKMLAHVDQLIERTHALVENYHFSKLLAETKQRIEAAKDAEMESPLALARAEQAEVEDLMRNL